MMRRGSLDGTPADRRGGILVRDIQRVRRPGCSLPCHSGLVVEVRRVLVSCDGPVVWCVVSTTDRARRTCYTTEQLRTWPAMVEER